MLRNPGVRYAAAGGVLVFLGVMLLVIPANYGNVRGGPSTPLTQLKEEGAAGTLSYSVYMLDANTKEKISPWHDIPLKPAGSRYGEYNFVCEIPVKETAKMEINKEAEFNPIKQDTKNGELRFYKLNSMVNYGALPQTWEDPNHREPGMDVGGDNDPLDVVELSTTPCYTGEVYLVRVLGALALLDGGEMDWKIVVVRASDENTKDYTDVITASTERSEFLTRLREWFRDYKIPEGKPANKFAFDGVYQSRDFAIDVVETQHDLWRALVQQNRPADAELWWQTKTN